jgi:MFS family permease
VADSFLLLLTGATLLGATTAANAQSRYAATDLALPTNRATALSLVVWATTIGAVAGPNLTGTAGSLAGRLGLPVLTGPFVVGFFGILAAGLVIGTFLRPDPLLLAREVADVDTTTSAPGLGWSRAVAQMRRSRGVAAGVGALALAHAVMVAVMVMTPLHMHHGGASLELIGVVISAHVLGMFAFAPLVGWGADRFGRPAMLGSGALVLLASLVLSGTSPAGASWQIGAALFLLGLGWSFTTVAASTLLSESAAPEARTDVQGVADLVMGLVAAAGGVVAGVVVDVLGFPALNVFAGLLVGGVAVAAVLSRGTSDRATVRAQG